MKFSEFESKMREIGFSSLAEIARFFDTTPQAVSNWKARDQVPHHLVIKINNFINSDSLLETNLPPNKPIYKKPTPLALPEKAFSFSDILIAISQQIKIIILSIFISVFLSFTYVHFIKAPKYISWVSLILPIQQTNAMGGISSLASQFGVTIPNENKADLSSPSFIPKLLESRTFAESIFSKNFFLPSLQKELSLLEILSSENSEDLMEKNESISKAISTLNDMIRFEKDPSSAFSIISISTSDPQFSRDLAEVVVNELDKLNRYFKSQTNSEKIKFINQRIYGVTRDLQQSEQRLKSFKEQNRQVTSPALQLEQDRLDREVEIQKEIFLTLKQQLELAKIEEVQEGSIIQILDKPEIPIGPSNKNLTLTLLLSTISGTLIGLILAFVRTYVNNSDVDERRKLRKVKNSFIKKITNMFFDKRFTGIVSIFLTAGLPIYLGYESKSPAFFGRYSTTLMIIIIIYISLLLFMTFLFIKNLKRNI